MMCALFGSMRYLGILRVHIEEEALGMDTALCGAHGLIGSVNIREAKVPGTGAFGLWMPPLPILSQVHSARDSVPLEVAGAPIESMHETHADIGSALSLHCKSRSM